MKKLLYFILLVMPLISNAQSDFNFLIENGKIIWKMDSVLVKSDIDIKSRFTEKLESLDGIEIINSSNPNMIRARMKNFNLGEKQLLLGAITEYVNGEIRIEINQGCCYKVKLSSLERVRGGTSYTFETQILKKKGTVFFNEIYSALPDKIFLETFKLD